MGYTHYERPTALDSSFLTIEGQNAHMHVGSVGLIDLEPLKAKHGGLDIRRATPAHRGRSVARRAHRAAAR